MKVLRIAFCSLVAFAGVSAQAQTADGVMNYDTVESLYQAHANQLVLNLDPQATHLSTYSTYGGAFTAQQSIGYGLEYGINNTFSFAVSDDYGSATTSSDGYGISSSGTSSISLVGKGKFDLNAHDKLIAWVTIAISPGNASSTSRYTGGNTYTPQIAYEHKVDANTLTALTFSTSYFAPRTTDEGYGFTDTESSGSYSSTLTASYEKNYSGTKMGGEFGVLHDYTGADYSTFVLVDVYGAFPLMNNLSLTPTLSYASATDAIFKKNEAKEFDILSLAVNLRYAF